MSKTKVAFLSSLHRRNDIRVFIKMLCSLNKYGYDLFYVVADGKGNETNNNIKILDVGKTNNRFLRMIISTIKVYKKALYLNADIYHLHDPELLPYAYLLSRKGKKVIADFHEDVPSQILDKTYIPRFLRKPFSSLYELLQKSICKQLSYIVTATPFIERKLKTINDNTIAINNFPILSELPDNKLNKPSNLTTVCFVGAISEARGFYPMIDSMKYTLPQIKMDIGGDMNNTYLSYILNSPNKLQINSLGFLERNQAKDLFAKSFAGILNYLPIANHINAQPNKMFEYMLAGLPVIASNFPLWKEIVEGNKCGICVNPESPKEIAEAINYLYTHPKEAKEMGENGRKAVFEKYNWDIEEKKLINIYKKLEE